MKYAQSRVLELNIGQTVTEATEAEAAPPPPPETAEATTANPEPAALSLAAPDLVAEPAPEPAPEPEEAPGALEPAEELPLATELAEALSALRPTEAPAAESETAEESSGTPWTLEETLDQHRLWLESNETAGQQANLSRADLSGVDLTDVSLRDAVLHKTVLKGADLLLTDFQGASLLQADLRGANLLGAKFRDANLQGATLADATGLQSQQLGGANLFGAALPVPSVLAGLRHVLALAKISSGLIGSMVLVVGLAWLRVITTSDAQLLTNAPVLPYAGLQDLLRLVPFYLSGPVLLLGLYICFHLGLQRLWDGAATQPAIFPDGRRLDAHLPWFARWPARAHLKWLREHNPSLSALEAGISILLLYWTVPLTLILFWLRYLTMQDLRGSLLHALLAAAAAAAALYFTRAASRAYGNKTSLPNPATGKKILRVTMIAPGLGLLLVLLSFGTIEGIPHQDRPGAEAGGWGLQSWAGDILWWAGYNPTAQLVESDISTKPPNWRGRDEDLALVEGARLNGLRLRYTEAYGAFFAKAHLWQADLTRAHLSEADLRDANLRQAILRSTALDRARLNRVMLQEADLQGANLTQANLQEADISRASLVGALLPDAKLDGANLYASDLRSAVLQRASLQHADLREARLEGANLNMAILRQAYLSSAKMAGAQLRAAQLAQTFLTQADLRRADLQGAGLQGAILNGADLTGANLQDVDLRGALGLTAWQICSAATVRQIQLDETLRAETESQCGLNR
jgi:uncharacterized protein YjbI with pentapeptide repeats